ncbi:RNA/RNP complex-1-interacting phosphatase homolog [Lineus longissimus]|uniref:RNA/RNP complex-1-interacting phosphatase homolog n=1 Tax=Lineus longissimus TaxID=88925 RepID=UPI00315DEC99
MSNYRGRGRRGRGGIGGNWRGDQRRGPGPVPAKWFDYKKLGERMEGSQFIIFKTPLKDDINRENNVPEDQRFTPSDLLRMAADKGYDLGLVIDMTNTKRYYQPTEFTSKGVEYEKMKLEGHGVVPSEEEVQSFRMTVDRFLCRKYNKLIGVHGTTSTNRPGYLICRYLMEKQNVEPSKAIEDFKTARGHPIDEQSYIDALMSFEPVGRKSKSNGDEDENVLHGMASASLNKQDCDERRRDGFTEDDYRY